jgi:hypothetical protein
MARFYNARGEAIEAADGICPDGCHVRTSVMLLDATQRDVQAHTRPRLIDAFGRPAGFRRGYVFVDKESDEQRAEAYQARKAQVADAWRTAPAAAAPEPLRTENANDSCDDGDAAYEAHKQRLTDAWRGTR